MLKLRMVERNILDNYADLPVGEVLRRARLQTGVEIPEISRQLNIRPEHLQAIEDSDPSRLPARVYAVGFVRSYAEYLELDSDKIVYLFKSQCIGHTESRDLHFPIPVNESRNPAWWMVAASAGTLAVIVAIFFLLSGESDNAAPELPAPVVQSKPPVPEQSPTSGSALSPILEQTGQLKIVATDTAWIEIRSSDKPDEILFSQVLKAGEEYQAPDISNLVFSTGNAEGVKVFLSDKEVDIFEGRTGVVQNLPISGLSAYKTKKNE